MKQQPHRNRLWLATLLLLLLAAGLLAHGLFSGEYKGVKQKAAAVCLECIGIG